MEKILSVLTVCFLFAALGQAAGSDDNFENNFIAATQFLGPVDFFWKAQDYDSAGFKAVTELGEVTLIADATHELVLEPNNKLLGGENFTSRLKLGGADKPPIPTSRALKIFAEEDCLIEVFALSASSTATRTLGFSDGKKEIHSDTVGGDHNTFSGKVSCGYKGGATDIYIYSKQDGINVYGIKVTYGVSGIKKPAPSIHTRAKVYDVYNLKGGKILSANMPDFFRRQLPQGLYIFKERKSIP